MTLPAGLVSDLFLADRTSSPLSAPQEEQLVFPSQDSGHLGIKPLLEVTFPLGIVWVGRRSDLDVAHDGEFGRLEEMDSAVTTVLVPHPTGKSPILTKVFGPYPAGALVVVSPFRPSPDCLEYLVVCSAEGSLADHVTVVVCPSSDDRIELHYQVSG